METLHLKHGRDERIKSGHLWVFAGEIAEDIRHFPPGEAVTICASRGEILGRGYINPHSLIAVRLLTRGDEPWESTLFKQRMERAFAYRRVVCPGWEALRLIYSESDGLPGLIVDKYGDHLVVQSLTAGIERRLNEVIDALKEVVQPQSILLKSNSPFRKLEGLPEEDCVLHSSPPDSVSFMEEGARLTAHPRHGQKSGFYLDQRLNRGLISSFVPGKRVLDLFSYTGAWGIRALLAGAHEAVMVDSSSSAIQWGMEDAAANGAAKLALFVEADVEDFLKESAERSDRYNVVILDPPSLIRSRSQAAQGINAYRALNRAAMKVVARDGLLVSCSCSHHLTRDKHLELIGEAAVKENRRIRLVATGGHPPDHPILPGHPETDYLKCWVLRCD